MLENQRFKLLVIEVPVISEIFPPLRITTNKTSRKSEVNFIRDQFHLPPVHREMTKVLKTTVPSQHDRFETPREPVRQTL